MKNSNISLKPVSERWMRAAVLAFLAVGVLTAANSFAGNQVTPEFSRHDWGPEQGLTSGAVHAISQTSDGYLWIGSESGLIRFDGFNFRPVDRLDSRGFSPSPVEALKADSAGNLWIQEERMNLLVYSGSRFQDIFQDLHLKNDSVTAMCRGKDGDILLLAPARGLLRYGRKGLETILVTSGIPNLLVISMAQTGDGTIWLGTRDAGLFSVGRDLKLTPVKGLLDRKINTLIAVGRRTLWIGTDNGAARWDGSALVRTGIPAFLQHIQILALLSDQKGNIWMSTARGLFRLSATEDGAWSQVGDSTIGVNALFQDREGNIWAGADSGIIRFRQSPFQSYAAPLASHTRNTGPIHVDDEGRIWSADPEGGLLWRKDGQFGKTALPGLNKDVVLSITGRKGELWIGGQRSGLTHIQFKHFGSFSTQTYKHAQGLAQDSVYTVFEDAQGIVWAGTLTGGVSRIKDEQITTYTEAQGLASNAVGAIAQGSDGTMWFGTARGLSQFSNGVWRRYAGQDGLPPGGVTCLFVDSNGVLWIGTPRGLAFLGANRIENCGGACDHLQEEILGIAEDKTGSLWIATNSRILSVNRAKLLNQNLAPGDLHEYGTTDGLLDTQAVRRSRSVVGDSQGQIWFSTNKGISVVNPEWLSSDRLPVIAHVQAISSDERALTMSDSVRIPAGRKRIKFDFVGLSLSFPERVMFRYKLDGFDQDWTQPSAARDAVYTNLGPGAYRFHVKASNAYGVWYSSDAAVGIEVAPSLSQSLWFRVSSALAILLAAALIYRSRLKLVSGRLKIRFEERLAERTRIAQELHDTLLQSFLSASMQVQVAYGRLTETSPAVPPLTRAIELMEQASREGRMTLRGLRSYEENSLDLEKSFLSLRDELGISESISFRVIVVGSHQLLQPALRNDVYRIGREALINAFRHSQGTHIEVELDYGDSEFRLLVRDDGIGIDPKLLDGGRDGHWGLTGMRERTQEIGAILTFWSGAAAGTELILRVPGRIAYRSRPSPGSFKWIRALLSNRVGSN